MDIQKGLRCDLKKYGINANEEVKVSIKNIPNCQYYCIGLNAKEVFFNENYFIFDKHLKSINSEISMEKKTDGADFSLKLYELPDEVYGLAFVLNIEEKQVFSDLLCKITQNETTIDFLVPQTEILSKKSIVSFELYRKNGNWRINAIGNGFSNGFFELVKYYEIKEEKIKSLENKPQENILLPKISEKKEPKTAKNKPLPEENILNGDSIEIPVKKTRKAKKIIDEPQDELKNQKISQAKPKVIIEEVDEDTYNGNIELPVKTKAKKALDLAPVEKKETPVQKKIEPKKIPAENPEPSEKKDKPIRNVKKCQVNTQTKGKDFSKLILYGYEDTGDELQIVSSSLEEISFENLWKSSNKKFHLSAVVLSRDGKTIRIGGKYTDEEKSFQENSVRFEEGKIYIKWSREIASIAISSYSSLMNGTLSMASSNLSLKIKGPNFEAEISSKERKSQCYTLCFCEIQFDERNPILNIKALEKYSSPLSEKRIAYDENSKIAMDKKEMGEFCENNVAKTKY